MLTRTAAASTVAAACYSRGAFTVMRRDIVLIVLIAAAAFGLRTYEVWGTVFSARGVNFLETDAWYHVRLAENQVRNYPWRVTRDPYAAAGGQFVPIAPLFDTAIATAAVLGYGRDATSADVERVAALMPPIFGVLAVVGVWALGRRLFDRRAGLIAAALLAVLPGHFLDRTMLGFVDHHALEAALAIAVLLTLVRGSTAPTRATAAAAGLAVGAYLLAWSSGAFLVAIVGAWLLLFTALARTPENLAAAATTTGVAAVVALLLVLLFQDPAMHRYASQMIGLVGLAAIAAGARAVADSRWPQTRRRLLLASLAVAAMTAAGILWLSAPHLFAGLLIDVGRLAPDSTRMSVLEARPLFLYAGEWRWLQPWLFFRTGFFIGLIALVPFAVRVWRHRRGGDLLLLVYTLATSAATIGQNRFGYYLVPACALLGGWLAVLLLDWGGVPHADNPSPIPRARMPLAREAALIAVAGGMFGPNFASRAQMSNASLEAYWQDTMAWLRSTTPAPFLASAGAGEEYYYARYETGLVPAPDYTVMNWWDQGYWIVQGARRVPVSNPTQERAPNAARFYVETDEARALALLSAERSRYVIADWELPYRKLEDGTIMGRFQSVLDWAGVAHAGYYEVLYQGSGSRWRPVWVFHEPYYRSMAFRLAVLGGRSAEPSNTTTLLRVASRVDSAGVRFREVLSRHTYATYAAARLAAAEAGGDAVIVGLDPWRSAFPVAAIEGLDEVYAARTDGASASQAPWVRVFEVRAGR